MVGVLEFYHPSQSWVEHIDPPAAVGYLHGGGAGVAVYGYHFNAQALELDSHFAELAAAEQEGLTADGVEGVPIFIADGGDRLALRSGSGFAWCKVTQFFVFQPVGAPTREKPLVATPPCPH